jgi:DNA polymerase-3 subunit epsilon
MMKNLFQKLFGMKRLDVAKGGYERQITQPIAAQISKPPASRELKDLLRETYRFVAVDVETANRNQGSICQIGMALVSADGTIDTIGILIDPEQDFEDFNVDLHGIDERAVRGAQTFEIALQSLRPFLERQILIQHSNFDKQALDAACAAYGIPTLRAKWLDSVQIARRAWPELKGSGGHGLANLKDHLNLKFEHHDAEEDARAAAEVTLLAEGKTGQSFSELSEPKKRQHKYQPSLAVDGNQQGALYGHIACFTGQLAMSRVEAATFAAGAGITVRTSVSKNVTLLVVGDQDMTLLAGHDKSSKHRRAEELMEQGHEIKIIGESEFINLVNSKSGN